MVWGVGMGWESVLGGRGPCRQIHNVQSEEFHILLRILKRNEILTKAMIRTGPAYPHIALPAAASQQLLRSKMTSTGKNRFYLSAFKQDRFKKKKPVF